MKRRLETLEFVENCKRASTADEIGDLFIREMLDCGMRYVACASHGDPLKIMPGKVVIINYPEAWLTRFSERDYARRDPVFFHARCSPYSFWWNEQIRRSCLAADQRTILNEAAECGLANGMTIPIYSPGAMPASCSLVPGADSIDPMVLPDLECMARYAHEEARLRSGGQSFAPIMLTPREHEVLELLARGKSDPLIAQILGITKRTAHQHAENIKQKYGVASRVQAVVLALADGNLETSDLSD
jgi:DNA-binding CsgD family transcriptional regulator